MGVGSSIRTRVAQEVLHNRNIDLLGSTRGFKRRQATWLAWAVAAAWLIGLATPWEQILQLKWSHDWAVRVLVAGLATIYLIGARALCSARVLEGSGRSALPAALGGVAPVLIMMATVALCWSHAPFIFVLLLPATAPLIHGSLCGGYIRAENRLKSHVRGVKLDGSIAPGIALPMVVVSLGHAFSYNLDYWVVGSILSTSQAAVYSAAARPAQLMLVIASAATPVLWTYFAAERARASSAVFQRREVLRLVLGFVVLGGFTVSVYAVVTISLGSYLTAGAAAPTPELILAFTVWGWLLIAHQPLAMMLNDARSLQWQVVSVLSMAAVNIILSIALTRNYGPAGAVWASSAALALVHVPVLAFRAFRIERRLAKDQVA